MESKSCPACRRILYVTATAQEHAQAAAQIPHPPREHQEPEKGERTLSTRTPFELGRTMKERMAQHQIKSAEEFYKKEVTSYEAFARKDSPEAQYQEYNLECELDSLGVDTYRLRKDAENGTWNDDGEYVPIRPDEIPEFDLPEDYFDTQFDASMPMAKRYQQWRYNRIQDWKAATGRRFSGRSREYKALMLGIDRKLEQYKRKGSDDNDVTIKELEADIEAAYQKWLVKRRRKVDYLEAFPRDAEDATSDNLDPNPSMGSLII